MAQLGPTTIYGDLTVTGKINGKGGGGGAGGITITAADLGIANYSSVKSTSGKVYSYLTTANTAANNIIVATFEELQYGTYSVMLRLALAIKTSTANLIKVETYHVDGSTETLLNTAYIKPSDFPDANTYEVFGFVTKFRGSSGNGNPSLRVKISIVANSTGNNLYFDYVMVAPTYASVYSLPTI